MSIEIINTFVNVLQKYLFLILAQPFQKVDFAPLS